MIVDFKLQQNARTADLGFATDKKCEKCGCVTSAYLEITVSKPSPLFISRVIICKGCLLEGVDIIDKGILEQTKTRV